MSREISGIAGVMDLGNRGQTNNPLEGFAEQLLRAKEMQRRAALENIDAAMKIAEYDPDTAEKLGVPALQEFTKHISGKAGGGSTSIFRQAYDDAQTKRQQVKDKAAAEIKHMDAETSELLERGGYEKSEAGLKKAQTDYELSVQESEKLLRDPKANLDPETRASHAIHVATARNLPADTADLLMMSPETRKTYLDAKTTRATTETMGKQLEVAEKLASIRHKDGTLLSLDESKKFMDTGEAPADVTTLGSREEGRRDRETAAKEREAKAYEAQTDIQRQREKAESAERIARAYKELAQAAHQLQGGGKTDLDTLLKGFQMMRDAQSAKAPLDPSLTKKMEDELAAHFGLEPNETRRLFGILAPKGYSLIQSPADPEATKDVEPKKESSAYDIGASVPAALQGAFTGTLNGIGEGTEQGLTAFEQFVRGMMGQPGKSFESPEQIRQRKGFVGPIQPGR